MLKNRLNLDVLVFGLRVVLDLLMVPVVIIFAYAAKFKIGWVAQNFFGISGGRIYEFAQVEPYLDFALVIAMIWVATFYFSKMYQRERTIMGSVDRYLKVFFGMSAATLILIGVAFIFPLFPGSRFFVLYTWLFGILFFSLNRMIVNKIEHVFRQKGIGQQRVLVIGADSFGQDLVEKLILNPNFDFNYIGTIDEKEPAQLHFHLRNSFKYLGNFNVIESIVETHNIDAIFVTVENFDVNPLLNANFRNHVQVRMLSRFAHFIAGPVSVQDFEGLPFIDLSFSMYRRKQAVIKRFLDVLTSCVLLFFLSPLFLIIALMIKISSPTGPVFYLQERVGYKGELFDMIKFRTMIPDAEAKTGPTFVNEKDEDRYIKYGRFLRRFSLDELPQLINVLKGEMSMIGPRPERAVFVDEYKKTIPSFSLRHEIKGGITGWAQVNGRSVLTRRPEHKIKYDLYYIKNWSLLLDLKILLKTIIVVFNAEEAY